jgi:hypothetical protein
VSKKDIDDFLSPPFVPSFKDGETREYEFGDVSIVDKKDFNKNLTKALRFLVRDPKSTVQSWKFFDLISKRQSRKVWNELKNGNNGKGWTVMEITRHGTGMDTDYIPKGIR